MIFAILEFFIILGLAGWVAYERHYGSLWRNEAELFAREILEYREARKKEQLERKTLTPKAEVVEHLPKRLSGAQLRRLNDSVNVKMWVDERPNSEILKENSNG